jgi:hypothetical protein
MTNSTQRTLSDWEKTKQAEELQKLFTALKKQGDLPGRVRDLVAEALNTSPTQVARMNAISSNLIPELAEEFKAGRLGVSAAYELSGLPEDKQRAAAVELREKGAMSINDVRARKQEAAPPADDADEAERDYDGELMREWNDKFSPKEEKAPSNALQSPSPSPKLNAKERAEILFSEQDCEKYKDIKCGNGKNIASFIKSGNLEGCAGCCAHCMKSETCEKVCDRVSRTTEKALLSCPFCGSELIASCHHEKSYFVRCVDCLAQGPSYANKTDAVTTWNKRETMFAYDETNTALYESLRLQSHYAELLNMYDGGERRQFSTVDEWITRLREIKRN